MPSYFTRRRIALASVVFLWVFVIFIISLGSTRYSSTLVIQDENASFTAFFDQPIGLSQWQCITYRWQATGVTQVEPSEPSALPSSMLSPTLSLTFGSADEGRSAQGMTAVCSTADTFVYITDEDGSTAYYELPIVWINPVILLFFPFTLTCLLVLVWRPAWLGESKTYSAHLLFFPLTIYGVGLYMLLMPYDLRGATTFSIFTLMLALGGFALTFLLRHSPKRAYVVICLTVVVLAFVIHGLRLFTSMLPLDVDEHTYANAISSAANGYGLTFSIINFPPIPITGGMGHGAWLYVGAYHLLGPHLYNLRLITWCIELAALPAVFLLFRRWYGTLTALVAIALFPLLWPIILSFVVRMDALAVTWVCWGLLLFDVARERNTWRWHMATGLFLALGLEAHMHTAILAMVCAALYLGDYIGHVRQKKRFVWPWTLTAYFIGIALGLGIYVVANILPDSQAYFKTISSVRSHWFDEMQDHSLLGRLLQSFVQIKTLLDNLGFRLQQTFFQASPVEMVLWLGGLISMIVLWREKRNRQNLFLFSAVLVISIFIFSNATPMYWSHITLPLFLCLPPFIMFGNRYRPSVNRPQETPSLYTLFAIATMLFPLLLTPTNIIPAKYYTTYIVDTPESLAQANFINRNVSTQCAVMGIYQQYLPHYLRYGRFYSTNYVWAGMAYYDVSTERELWEIVQPDVIIDTGKSFESLIQWSEEMRYELIGPKIYRKTHTPLSPGCVISTED